ncbi:ttn-1, partial [Symbiodinium necroappetens]
GTKHTFRYTLVGAQRELPLLKGSLAPAWEMLSRWEAVEPVVHRTPLPEPLLKAMVTLSWRKGFRRACSLLASYGMARVREVLKSRHEHLMLPADMFYNVGAVFLRLEASKTSLIGRPKVQHIRVDDEDAIALIVIAFGGLGLRGGGSVAAYHRGGAITDIQWKLPLKHRGTFEHYLQEVAAVAALDSASEDSKLLIRFALSALRAVLISSAMVVLTCRWWLAVGSLATAVAFKVAEASMEIVKTDNETLKKEVEGIAAKNMEAEFKEMNDIPNPANFTLNGSMPNASQGVWADQRVGELGKSFEFMMLKLAQLETLCELQQAELETLRKTVKGLAEHVDHPDSVASLVQKDEKARMQETQQTLKRVLAKHAQQHKNKDFHPKASRQNYRPADAKPESPKRATEAGASDRAELLAGGARQSGSKGSQRIFGEVARWAGDRIEDVQSIAESTADAYSAATDKVASASSDLLQVAFIANTAIDTVEMAVAILLKGFSDWGADCEISGPSIRDYIEECEITGSREQKFGWFGTISVPIIECRQRSVLMALDWGRQKCKISLMGQEITLFDFNFGSLEMTWPAPIETAIDIGTGLSNCGDGNIFTCLGSKILNHITWPDKLKKVVDGNVQDLLPDKLQKVADGNVQDLLPDELKKVADGNVQDLLPDKLKKVADGNVQDLLPDELKKVADGNVQDLLPDKLKKVADGNIQDLLPDKLKKVVDGKVQDLLPSQMKITLPHRMGAE